MTLTVDGDPSHITTLNTMFNIPTVYRKGSADALVHSNNPSHGTAYAHTQGGVTRNYRALAAYNCTVVNGKLMSLSGKLPTKSMTLADFRTAAEANGDGWGLWKYWDWQLLKEMTFFALKSFNGQNLLGQGGYTCGSNTTGTCDQLGMFAGDVTGTSSSVKCFVEDWWGSQYNFIDDFINNSGTVYAGQQVKVTDDIANMVQIDSGFTHSSGFPSAIRTGDEAWGMGTNISGDRSKGLCDRVIGSTSASRIGYVGSSSGLVSNGYAGPSYLNTNNTLSTSNTNFGARLAFSFDGGKK